MNFPVTYQKHSSGLLQECCLEVEPGVLGTDLENLQNVQNSSNNFRTKHSDYLRTVFCNLQLETCV